MSPIFYKFAICMSSFLPIFLCFYSLDALENISFVVVSKIPHELPAFTQGLTIIDDQLYESTGLYGESSLRRLDIKTGKVLQKKILPPHFFGEGIASFSLQIIQITWKEQQAFVYERESFQLKKIISYEGEGWGLCQDENTVWMSNGSAVLTQRDLHHFAIIKNVQVTLDRVPIYLLNDLTCAGNYLYANMFQKNSVAQINKWSGEITGIIDASFLLLPEEKKLLGAMDVLNGIAYRPKTKTFFLTGKNWPWIFEIRIKN